jgi:hypothetical protein
MVFPPVILMLITISQITLAMFAQLIALHAIPIQITHQFFVHPVLLELGTIPHRKFAMVCHFATQHHIIILLMIAAMFVQKTAHHVPPM